jgi:hypothetical protein
MKQFITWYCSEPRPALNPTVVLGFQLHLESLGLAADTINQRLAAVRSLAYEAADSGLLSPERAAGIRRVYQAEARRQGSTKYVDDYEALPEDTKEFDRVIARFIRNEVMAKGESFLSSSVSSASFARPAARDTGRSLMGSRGSAVAGSFWKIDQANQ